MMTLPDGWIFLLVEFHPWRSVNLVAFLIINFAVYVYFDAFFLHVSVLVSADLKFACTN